ncbi:MAG TPA: PIG-L family deacetylase [Ktedonobacteraceae bacterium]|nr:PIG-L family deacetylase [Ktedonobacteraceae bacterium]
MATKRLLGIFPHPDDEGTMSGALLKYGQAGVETGLICITRGEVGEISDPALATPENLGEVREGEMRAATKVLDLDNLWFIGYRDSGMVGTPENKDPRSLEQANPAEVVGKLVAVIRQFRPQVLVTFDETGGYGHPDHIAAYRHTTSAFYAAADAAQYPELGPAHLVSKLYYSSFPRSAMRKMGEWMRGQNVEVEEWVTKLDPEKLGLPDEQIDVRLDVQPYLETKGRSWAMHRTQMNPNNSMARIPEEIQLQWRRYEYFHLAATRVGPDVASENDLFARVEASKN